MKTIGIAATCISLSIISFCFNAKDSFAEIDVDGTYKMVCELCHGPDGKGTLQGQKFKVPDFSDKEWQSKVSDEDMIKTMTDGSDNPKYSEGVIPLLEMIGIENPKDVIPEFIPKVRSFAK